MPTTLLQIEIQCSFNGEEFTVAQYCSPVVPRKQEFIDVEMCPHNDQYNGRFLVLEVAYQVINFYPVEGGEEVWPVNHVSDSVIIDALPVDEKTKKYVQLLAKREKQIKRKNKTV